MSLPCEEESTECSRKRQKSQISCFIIRGSTAGNAFPSTMPLNDEALTMLGSAKNPFIVDDTRQGILES